MNVVPVHTLLDPLASRLADGLPVLDIARYPHRDDLPDSGWVRLAAGDWSGWTWIDRGNDRLHVLADNCDDPVAGLAARLTAARSRRQPLEDPQEVQRWINGPGDGCSGFSVDYYATWALVQLEGWDLVPLAEQLKDVFVSWGCQGLVLKVREKGRRHKGRVPQQVWQGRRPPEDLVVRENGIPFAVRIMGTLNTGLFHDLRTLRAEFARATEGKGLLNLFCYTGAFSIAAAVAGARRVTSVDANRGVLDWAKHNVALSGYDPDAPPFRWQAKDAFEALERFDKRGEVFERIIIDPPAQSRAGKGRFFIKSDLDRLIAAALKVSPPGGTLLVTDNTRQGTPQRLEKHLDKAAETVGVTWHEKTLHEPEADFPVHPLWPKGRGVLAFEAVRD